jgi:hypothetical protein
MKTMKLTVMVAGVGLMLCGCGKEVFSGDGHQSEKGYASVQQYASQDGRWRVVGPVWDCSKQIDCKWYYPIMVAEKGKDGHVCWCREVSHGSSGNFDIVSNDGAFYFSDNSFCYSDEMKDITYMDFISSTTTNRVVLNRIEP